MHTEKNLWQRYGKLALLMVFAVLFISASMQFMHHRKVKHQKEASVRYEKLLALMQKSDFNGAQEEGKAIIKDYAKTPYSALSAFLLSRVAVDQNNLAQAKEWLTTAMSLGKNGPFEDIARIRLARILQSEGKVEEALALLPDQSKESKESGFVTLYEELRGDIYFKQNEFAKAKECYAKAIKAAPGGLPLTALQLKFTDLNITDLNAKTDLNIKKEES